jgi:DNA-directed RNA polymerase specialized sigma subunit
MLNSSEHITAKDLENLYGRAMKPTELAKFLGIDVRTVKKYGDRWGGVEVAPVTCGSLKIEYWRL